jgi:tetratricopeptide (TPR) repeat protein
MRIAGYEVLEVLATHSQASVFRARSDVGEDVAVKILSDRDTKAFRRFERERRLLGQFTAREGFVPLLDVGVAAEGPYLVMPFIPGGTLRERLRKGPLGVEATVALGRALAEAVGRAHARGIVHRDLKPENVLFSAEGQPLVADLGLAKHFDRSLPGGSESVAISSTGQHRGTPGYMPLEQIEDAMSADARSDVFALGAILHECLSGRPALPGGDLSQHRELLGSGGCAPLDRSVVPGWLADAIERALSPRPGDRFRDGFALRDALARRSGRPPVRVALVVLALALTVSGGLVAMRRAPATPVPSVVAPPPTVPVAPRSDFVSRGLALLDIGRRVDAIAAFTSAIVLEGPTTAALFGRARARLHLPNAVDHHAEIGADVHQGLALDGSALQGRVYIRRTDEELGELLREAPDDPVALETAVSRDFVHGRLDEALAHSEHLVAVSQGKVYPRVIAAQVLWKCGEKARARAAFDSLIAEVPGATQALYLRARLREEEGDAAGCDADLDAAIRADPMAYEALFAKAARIADRHQAIALYDQVLAFEPQDASALRESGRLLMESGETQRGLARLEQGHAAHPQDAATLGLLVAAHWRLRDTGGSLESAATYAAQTLELDPNSRDAIFVRANILAASEEKERALADFERLLALIRAGEGTSRLDLDAAAIEARIKELRAPE